MPIAVVLIPLEGGLETVILGSVPYPTPASMTLNLITPKPLVTIEQVAAAPVPPPPLIVIVGATVYPAPAFISNIFSIEVILDLVVMNPTADALSLEFPVGEDEIPMVGIDVYPLPSLFKNISLIYPLATVS